MSSGDQLIRLRQTNPTNLTLTPPPHPLKSNRGMDTLPSSSGAFLCLLESGELLAFWFSTPNRLRLRMDSRGRTATAMGKLILGETRRGSGQEEEEEERRRRRRRRLTARPI